MQSPIGRCVALFSLALATAVLGSGAGVGCAKGEADTGPQGAGAGSGGAGQGGASGTGGALPDASSGGASGTGAIGGSGGNAGAGGSGGSAGSGDGGSAGGGGSAGAAGAAGTTGTGGTGGAAGTGGTSGTGGTGGTGGSGGTGATGGTGGALNGTLFFSEYVEGDSNNKAVELFNGSSAAIDLTNCLINRYQNGNATAASNPVQLAAGGTLASGQLYTVCSEYAGGTLLAYCDQLDQRVDFNGNDAVELVCNGVTVDVIGQIGADPGATGWGSGDVTTTNHTLIRKCAVTQGRTNGTSAFDPAVEWDGFPLNTFDHLGTRPCP